MINKVITIGSFLIGVFFVSNAVAGKKIKSDLPVNVKNKLDKKADVYLSALKRSESSNGLPNGLLVRMAYQESRFRPEIIFGGENSAGAIGILQIIPRWHPDVDPSNPYDSIDYAGGLMRRLFERFGQWDKALAAYNWGETNVSKRWTGDYNDLPMETKNYILEIGADVGVV